MPTTTTTTTTTNFIDSTKFFEKTSKAQIVIENVEQNQSETINLHRTASAPIHHSISKQQNKSDSTSKRLTTVAQLVKQQQQFNATPAPGEGRHSIYAKNDILQMLNQGLTLRLVFFNFFFKPEIQLESFHFLNNFIIQVQRKSLFSFETLLLIIKQMIRSPINCF
jgi:hypothetical protein